MMLVKIDRDSVKKNPNAGNDRVNVFGAWHIDFEIKGELPDFLIDGENCFIEWQSNFDGRVSVIKGSLKDFTLKDKLLELKHVKVHEHRDVETYYGMPERKWLYKYENPEIKCNDCQSMVKVDDVEIDYDDDGNEMEFCPVCKNLNTFEEVKYEEINEVVKTLKLE